MARETAPAPRNERSVPSRYADPFDGLRGEMNALIDSFFGRGLPYARTTAGATATGQIVPHMDVRESETEIAVEVELPGMDQKDVSVTLQNGLLSIKGEKTFEAKDDKENYHVIERRYGSFQRSLRLPETVDEGAVEANFQKGLLTVRLPKRAEATAQQKKIEIKSN